MKPAFLRSPEGGNIFIHIHNIMMYQTETWPLGIEENRESVVRSWDRDRIAKIVQIEICDDDAFLRRAGVWVKEYFSNRRKNAIWKHPVLETHAGDRKASEKFREGLNQRISDWICTDILDEVSCHAVDAVEKYGKRARVLVMIRPPDATSDTLYSGDGGGGDLYALNDFVRLTCEEEPRFVIMVGKIGSGHGTRGLYRYLVEKLCMEELWWRDETNNDEDEKHLDAFPRVRPVSPGVMIIPIIKKAS
jgi:hypothetical protein